LKTRFALKVVSIAMMAGLAFGCARYYRVTDPASGKAYHTTEIDRSRRGFIEFEDAKSGDRVTLQSSEVKKITKYEFERDTH